jgi:hypothetical protein
MGANEMHALFSVVAEVRCFLSIYEGTVTSANGTLLTSASNNRVVLGDPRTTVLYSGPTVTSVGTLLSYELRTATGLNDNRSEGEWILAPNTKYLFRIAPSANTRVGFKMQGYEE